MADGANIADYHAADRLLTGLLGKHRRRDGLIEATARLEARLHWLLAGTPGAPPPALGTGWQSTNAGAGSPLRNDQVVQDIERLEREVVRLRAEVARAEQALPTPTQANPDVPLPAARLAAVKFVLRHAGLLDAEGEIYPTGPGTGEAVRSAVYFLEVRPSFGPAWRLAAKFDVPERAAREWRAVDRLRQLHLPAEILLPLPFSHPEDGVIIFPLAGGDSGTAVQMLQYLRPNLLEAPRHCCRCLRNVLGDQDATGPAGALHLFHQIQSRELRAATVARPHTWKAALPETWTELRSEALTDITESLRTLQPGRDWSAAAPFEHLGAVLPRPLWNFFPAIRALLRDKPSERAAMGYIHGDLHLGNLLVCPRDDGSPQRVFVIDLDFTERDRVRALDFARLEVSLWQKALLPEGADWLADFVAARDYLDGRLPAAPAFRTPAAGRLCTVVNYLRHLAWRTLRPEAGADHYVLNDYFYTLFFTFLSMLRFPDVRADEQARLMVAGAALTFETIRSFHRYSADAEAPLHRPWRRDELAD